MKRGIKKFIKLAKKASTKLPKRSPRLREIAHNSDNAKGATLVKITEGGDAIPKKNRKAATHIVMETPEGGAIAEPLKSWPKPPAQLSVAQSVLPQADEPSEHDVFGAVLPPEATYLMWITASGQIMWPIRFLEEYRHRKGGQLKVGKLRYGEDFVVLSPLGEKGNVIRWKDGVTCFAEGNSPDELKKAEKAAAALEARRNDPQTKAILEAGRAKRAATRIPAGPRPDDIPGVRQNGVAKPKDGSKTGAVWAMADELAAKHGRTPTKDELVAADKGATNSGTLMTQFSAWRRFNGRS
jgi:hypothetical protein